MRLGRSRTGSGAGSLVARRGGAVLRFVLVAYGLSWAGQIAIWVYGGLEGRLFQWLAPFLMFAPAVAALVACRTEGASFIRLLSLRGRAAPLAAAVLVPVATALGAAFAIGIGLGGSPIPWTRVAGGFAVSADGPFLWSGVLSLPSLLADVVVTAVWLAIVGGLLAVGEEVGWRGYLQPRLCSRFGTYPGLLGVGLLWAFWHLPLLLLGYVFPQAPVVGGFLLFPCIGIGMSFFLGWLRDASGGIWAPVLAHGSYNAFFGTLVFTMSFGRSTWGAYLIIVALTLATGALSLPLLRPTREGVPVIETPSAP